MIKYLAIGVLALSVPACATTPAGQQSDAQKADQEFGKAKVALMVATVAVSGYNVVCAGNLKGSSVCAPATVDIVNTALQAASDAIVGAERVFAGVNSTTDQKMQAVNAATALVTELTRAVAKYVPAPQRQG